MSEQTFKIGDYVKIIRTITKHLTINKIYEIINIDDRFHFPMIIDDYMDKICVGHDYMIIPKEEMKFICPSPCDNNNHCGHNGIHFFNPVCDHVNCTYEIKCIPYIEQEKPKSVKMKVGLRARGMDFWNQVFTATVLEIYGHYLYCERDDKRQGGGVDGEWVCMLNTSNNMWYDHCKDNYITTIDDIPIIGLEENISKQEESKMEFKVGDRVVLTSKRHGMGISNPVWKQYKENVIGTIIDCPPHLRCNVEVKWDTGARNSHYVEDLQLLSTLKDGKYKYEGGYLIRYESINKFTILKYTEEILTGLPLITKVIGKNKIREKLIYNSCEINKRINSMFWEEGTIPNKKLVLKINKEIEMEKK